MLFAERPSIRVKGSQSPDPKGQAQIIRSLGATKQNIELELDLKLVRPVPEL